MGVTVSVITLNINGLIYTKYKWKSSIKIETRKKREKNRD